MLKGLNEAVPGGNTPTLSDGLRVVEVQALTLHDGFFGLSFIAEVKVLESDDNKDPVSSERKISIGGLDDRMRQEMSYGAVKSLLAALVDVDPFAAKPDDDYTWEEFADEAVQDDQPLAGCKIAVDSLTKTSKAGHQYKVWNFEPCND
jgi:hypothetical protein